MANSEMMLTGNFRNKEINVMYRENMYSFLISTCNFRGLTHRVWRGEDLREIAFKQAKNRSPIEMGIQDGEHTLNMF